jgi:hypothetical protein
MQIAKRKPSPRGKPAGDVVDHELVTIAPPLEAVPANANADTDEVPRGRRVGVVRSAEEMLELLDAWGIPRARRLVLLGLSESAYRRARPSIVPTMHPASERPDPLDQREQKGGGQLE